MNDGRTRPSGRVRRFVVPLVSFFAATAGAAGPLERVLTETWTPERYLAVDAGQSAQAEALFISILADSADAQQKAAALDMVLEPVGPGLRVLRESAAHRGGRGVYFFRAPEAAVPLALQAPHARSDRHTGVLAVRLMASGRARALALNSAPRRIGQPPRNVDADLAHLPDSWMLAFTRAFAHALPQGRIVQLHGFSAEKRSTREGREADLIISPGHLEGSLPVLAVAACLAGEDFGLVRRFPDEVAELGGTTNVMARWLRAAGSPGFVHIEMVAELRNRLRKSPDLLARLGNCLEQAL